MQHIPNPSRTPGAQVPVATDPGAVLALLAQCPVHEPTPLVNAKAMADGLGIAALHVKDERARMGLGSFKALGASFVIARDAAATGTPDKTALKGRTYITASAGNHGMSLAAGAAVFGADAVVYVAETVPQSFADRLEAKGARVVREGAIYEDSMAAAAKAAADNGWTLLSDSTWPDYDGGLGIMEGYLAMSAEAAGQIDQPPTHIFLQAGVGGLAAAACAHARATWGEDVVITIVEPSEAPALYESIRRGEMCVAAGGVSSMGRLDCKEPSLRAFDTLKVQADHFMTLTDDTVESLLPDMAAQGLATSPSGGAALAGLMVASQQGLFGLGDGARALIYLSEGPVTD